MTQLRACLRTFRTLARSSALPVDVLNSIASVLAAGLPVKLNAAECEEFQQLLSLGLVESEHPAAAPETASASEEAQQWEVLLVMLQRCAQLGYLSPAQPMAVCMLRVAALTASRDEDECADDDSEWSLVDEADATVSDETLVSESKAPPRTENRVDLAKDSMVGDGLLAMLRAAGAPWAVAHAFVKAAVTAKDRFDALAVRRSEIDGDGLRDEVATAVGVEVGDLEGGLALCMPRSFWAPERQIESAHVRVGRPTAPQTDALHATEDASLADENTINAVAHSGCALRLKPHWCDGALHLDDVSVSVHGRSATRMEEMVLTEACRAVTKVMNAATALEAALALVAVHVEARHMHALSESLASRSLAPSLELRADEEWAKVMAETAGVPLRSFGPTELKRVALMQINTRLMPSSMRLLSAEPILHERHFATFQRCLAAQRELAGTTGVSVVSPTLAFHGATSAETLEAISASGLLAPGEVDQRSGCVLGMRHWARFGDGRYLTQDLGLARHYGGGADLDGRERVLLCLIAPGHCEHLPRQVESDPMSMALRQEDWHLARCRIGSCAAPSCDGVQCQLAEARVRLVQWRERNSNPKRPTDGMRLEQAVKRLEEEALGVRRPNFASRISPDQKQFVLAHSDQVLPLLVLTYEVGARSRVRSGMTYALQPQLAPTAPACTFHALDDCASALVLAASKAAKARAAAMTTKRAGHQARGGIRFRRALARAAEERRRQNALAEAASAVSDASMATTTRGGSTWADVPSVSLLAPALPSFLLPGETSDLLRVRASHALDKHVHVTITCADATAVTASPALVTLGPPKHLHMAGQLGASPKVKDAQGITRDDSIILQRSPPYAEFRLTALRATLEPVTISYTISGEGAADVLPPLSSKLAIKPIMWAAVIPRQVVLDRCRSATSALHLALVIHLPTIPMACAATNSSHTKTAGAVRGGSAERAAVGAAAHMIRELQPKLCTALMCSPSVGAVMLCSRSPPERAISVLRSVAAASSQSLPVGAATSTATPGVAPAKTAAAGHGTAGLVGGVSLALSSCLDQLQVETEQRILRAHAQAEQAVWYGRLCLPEWRKQQPGAFARATVLALIENAIELGSVGASGRLSRVKKAAKRAHNKISDGEDSLAFMTIIDLGDRGNRGNVGGEGPSDSEVEARAKAVLGIEAKRVRGAQLQLAVRVLGIGPYFDPAPALTAKSALQSVHAWESQPLFHAQTLREVPRLTRSLCSAAQLTTFATPLEVSLPYAERRLHCGMVEELGSSPRWARPMRVGGEEAQVLLFQVRPPVPHLPHAM